MSRFNCLVVFVATVLAAGCAAAPEEAPGDGAAQVASPESPAADSNAALAQQTENTEATNLNVEDFAPSETAGVVCRDMLRPASNVIVRYCGTPAEWKEFERQQARWSQEMVRRLQRGTYR
jgi:hypothetical protein